MRLRPVGTLERSHVEVDELTEQRLSVLATDTIHVSMLRVLEAHLPDGVTLVRLPSDRRVPAAGREAAVLFTAGLPRHELSALIAQLPGLLWVHGASAGVDRLLVPEARRLQVTRTAQARAAPMAEHVLTMTLALLKRLPELLAAQRERRWERREVGSLRGATVVIVGAGSVGRAAAARFRPFDARTVGVKRTPGPVSGFDEVRGADGLDELLGVADVLVLACPLTTETRHLLGSTRFALMKPTALLVNVSRGAVVAENALLEALEAGVIAGAALDVFAREPLPPEHPFWGLSNVIVSPHAASAGPGVREAVAREFLGNLERFLRGEPLPDTVRSWEAGY